MNNKRSRIFSFLLVVFLFFISINGVYAEQGINPLTDNEIKNSTKEADPSTMDSYKDLLLTENENGGDSRRAGRVWSDKSVFAEGENLKDTKLKNDQRSDQSFTQWDGTELELDEDTDGLKATINLKSDSKNIKNENFLHAFSLLGSSQVVNTEEPIPLDVVLLLDISTSMCNPNQGENDPLHKMLDEANELIGTLLDTKNSKIHESNRVSIIVYGGGTQELLPLKHYSYKEDNSYLSLEAKTGESSSKYFPKIKAQTKELTKSSEFMTADSTYLQGALYQGMNELANSTFEDIEANRSRQPVLIVLSDGGTNVVTADSITGTIYSFNDGISASGDKNVGSLTNDEYSWNNPYVGTIPTYNYNIGPDGLTNCPLQGNPVYGSIRDNSNQGEDIMHIEMLSNLLLAGSMKKRINDHYSSQSSGNIELKGYSILLNSENLGSKEKQQMYTTLDPKNYFNSNSQGPAANENQTTDYTITRKAFGEFNEFLKTDLLTLNGHSTWYANGGITGTFNYKHLEGPDEKYDIKKVSDVYYIDKSYKAEDETLGNIFDQIVEEITGEVFTPVGGVNSNGLTDSLTYSDPIGDYMEVKDVKNMVLFGHNYELTKSGIYNYNFNSSHLDETGKFKPGFYNTEGKLQPTGHRWNDFDGCQYYLDYNLAVQYDPSLTSPESGNSFNDLDEKEQEKLKNTEYTFYRIAKDGNVSITSGIEVNRPNLSYGKKDNHTREELEDYKTTFNLKDIRIWIEDTGDYIDQNTESGEIISSTDYDEALYINIPSEALPLQVATINDPKGDGTQNVTYSSNLDDKAASTPLRVFYSVGIEDSLLDDEGLVDLTKVSQTYIDSHKDSEGNVFFYSNYYIPKEYSQYATSSYSYTYGDPYLTFSPTSDNRYYIFQKPLTLYNKAYIYNGENWQSVSIGDLGEEGSTQIAATEFGGNILAQDLDLTEIDGEQPIGEKISQELINKNLSPENGDIVYLKQDRLDNVNYPEDGVNDPFSSDKYYFFGIEYYKTDQTSDEGTRKAELTNYAITRKGSEFGSAYEASNITNGQMLCWYDASGKHPEYYPYNSYTLTGDESRGRDYIGAELDKDGNFANPLENGLPQKPDKETNERFLSDGNWVVAAKPGGLRVGSLAQSVYFKSGNYDNNTGFFSQNYTQTSNTYYLPTISNGSDLDKDVRVNEYLGNNGRLSVEDSILSITKEVANKDQLSEGLTEKDFNFQVYIEGLTGTKNAIVLIKNPQNGLWQRRVSTIDLLTTNQNLLANEDQSLVIWDLSERKKVDSSVFSDGSNINRYYYVYIPPNEAQGDESSQWVRRVYSNAENGVEYLNGKTTTYTETTDGHPAGTTEFWIDNAILIPADVVNQAETNAIASDISGWQYDPDRAVEDRYYPLDHYTIAYLEATPDYGLRSGTEIKSDYDIRTEYLTKEVTFGLEDEEVWDQSNFKITETDRSHSGSSDEVKASTAHIQLKDGEGLLFNSIASNSEYRVTENLGNNFYDGSVLQQAIHVQSQSITYYDSTGENENSANLKDFYRIPRSEETGYQIVDTNQDGIVDLKDFNQDSSNNILANFIHKEYELDNESPGQGTYSIFGDTANNYEESVHYLNLVPLIDKTEISPGNKEHVNIGDEIFYKIQWQNYQVEDANVTIIDPLDTGVTFETASFDPDALSYDDYGNPYYGGSSPTIDPNPNNNITLNYPDEGYEKKLDPVSISYDESTHTVKWDLGRKVAGTTGYVLLKVKVNDKALDYWNGYSGEEGSGNDYHVLNRAGISLDNNPEVYTKIVENPIGEEAKTETVPGEGKQVKVGDYIAYEINWVNYENGPADITITDILDKGVNFVGAYIGQLKNISGDILEYDYINGDTFDQINGSQPKLEIKDKEDLKEGNLKASFPNKETKIKPENSEGEIEVSKEDKKLDVKFLAEDTEKENPDKLKYEINFETLGNAGENNSRQTVTWLLKEQPSAVQNNPEDQTIGKGVVTVIVRVNEKAKDTWNYSQNTYTSVDGEGEDYLVKDQASIQVNDNPLVRTKIIENPLEPAKQEVIPGRDESGNNKEVNIGDEVTYEIQWHNTAMDENNLPKDAIIKVEDPLDKGVDFVSAKYDPDRKYLSPNYSDWFSVDPDVTNNIELTAQPGSSNYRNPVYAKENENYIEYKEGHVIWNIAAQAGQDGVVELTVRVNNNARKTWNYNEIEEPGTTVEGGESNEGYDNLIHNRAGIQVENENFQYTQIIDNPVTPSGFYIKKQVLSTEEESDTNKKYNFTISILKATSNDVDDSFTNSDSVSYQVENEDAQYLSFVKGVAKDQVELEKDQQVLISGLNPGTHFLIEEDGQTALGNNKVVWTANSEHTLTATGIIGTIIDINQLITFTCNNISGGNHKIETSPGNNIKTAVGDKITYTIPWENTSDETADIIIKDPLDIGLTYIEGSAQPSSNFSYQANERLGAEIESKLSKNYDYSGVLTWELKGISSGDKGFVSFEAIVNENALQDNLVENEALVSINNEWTTTEHVNNPLPEPEKEEVIPGNQKTVGVGREITYKIYWENTSSETRNIKIVDPLDVGLEYLSSSSPGVYERDYSLDEGFNVDYPYQGAVIWDLKEKAPGTKGSVTLNVRVKEEALPQHIVKDKAFVQIGNAWYPTSEPVNPLGGPEKEEINPGNGNSVAVGQEITYRIHYINNTNSTTSITIVDPLDNGLTFKWAQSPGNYDPNQSLPAGAGPVDYDYHGIVTWVIPNVVPYGEGFVELKATVNENAKLNNIVKNKAFVSVANLPFEPTEEPENPLGGPKKTETDPGDKVPVKVGQKIKYRIDWENYQNEAAKVVITDQLDPGVDFEKAYISENGLILNKDKTSVEDNSLKQSIKYENHTVSWDLGSQPKGQKGSVYLEVVVNENAFKSWSYDNQTLGNGDNDNKVYNQAVVSIENQSLKTEIVENPVDENDLKPHKIETSPGDKQTVGVDKEITYRIDYINDSDTTQTVKIYDPLDIGLTYKDSTVPGYYEPDETKLPKDKGIQVGYKTHGFVYWEIPNVPANSTGSVFLSVIVNEDAKIKKAVENKAFVEVNNKIIPTEDPDNPIGDKPKKEEKDPGKGKTVKIGDIITYEITWINSKDKAADVKIKDILDPGVDFVSADNGGEEDKATHSVNWTLKQRAAGTSGKVTLKVRVNEKAKFAWEYNDYYNGTSIEVNENTKDNQVLNKATVQLDNDSAVETETIDNPVGSPEKIETDPGNGQKVSVGQVLTYEITWTNYKSEAAEVIITDRLDPGVSFVSAENNGDYNPDSHTITWNLGKQDANKSGKVSFKVKVNEKAYNSFRYPEMVYDETTQDNMIYNQASVKVGQDPEQFTEIPENPLEEGPNKTEINPGERHLVQIGDTVDYEISFKNYEQEEAIITVTDKLDPGVDFFAASYLSTSLENSISDDDFSVNQNNTSISYSPKSHTVTWVINRVMPGEEGKVNLSVVVNGDSLKKWSYKNPVLENDTDYMIYNQASVQINNNPAINTNIVENPVADKEVMIEKYHKLPDSQNKFHTDDNLVSINKTICYELIATNALDYIANNVVVEDYVPANLTIDPNSFNVSLQNSKDDRTLTVTPIITPVEGGKNLVNWNLGNLNPKEKVLIDFNVTVNESSPDSWWINHAYLTYDDIEEETRFGGKLKQAESQDLTNELTEESDIVSTLGLASVQAKPATAQASKLQNRVEVDKNPLIGIPVGSTIYYSGSQTSGNKTYIYSADVREYLNEPEPTIEKDQQINGGERTKEIQTVTRGDTDTYYLTVTNPGDFTLTGVTVIDPIPSELEYVEGSASNGGIFSNNQIIWNIGDLAPKQVLTLSFSVKVPLSSSAYSWVNEGYLDWDNNPSEPIPSNEVEIQTPQLEIQKEQQTTNSDGTIVVPRTKEYIEFSPGESVTYFITVTNTSSVAATNVIITDPIPQGLELIPDSVQKNQADSVSIVDGVLTWSISKLNPGESDTVEVSFSCQLPENVTEKVYFRNTAYVNWNENGPNSPTPSNEVIIGDPPDTPGNPNNNNTDTTNTSTKTSKVTTNRVTNNNNSRSASPKTGVDSLLGILAGLGLLGSGSAGILVKRNKDEE